MSKSRFGIRVKQLNLHPNTVAILETYYPKPKTGERLLTLEDATLWNAFDAWLRYKEYLARVEASKSSESLS